MLPGVDCSGPAVTSGPPGIQAEVDVFLFPGNQRGSFSVACSCWQCEGWCYAVSGFCGSRHPKLYLMFPYKLKRLGMVGWEEGGVFGSMYGNIRWAWPMYEEVL